MRMRFTVAALLATGFTTLALAVTTVAYVTTRGYIAQPYATGFPKSAANHWGPIGVAFDRSDRLYVADTVDGNIYRFPRGGGAVSPATRLTRTPVPGRITGLAFNAAGQLYLARYSPGDVVQINPRNGRVIRVVASVRCATGLAVDPVSGSLFVSEDQCGTTIWRISHYRHGPGTVTPYATAPGVDGLVFGGHGNLYGESDANVIRIDGTGSATPSAITGLAHVPHADGLAVAVSRRVGLFLVVNRTDGIVTHVNFHTQPATLTNIFTGGSRGDLAAVDSHGCLYVTQTAQVLRLAVPHQRCSFQPTTRSAR
jgi:sugar lactone lactonase YvrE